jgi:hypothetical protein
MYKYDWLAGSPIIVEQAGIVSGLQKGHWTRFCQ